MYTKYPLLYLSNVSIRLKWSDSFLWNCHGTCWRLTMLQRSTGSWPMSYSCCIIWRWVECLNCSKCSNGHTFLFSSVYSCSIEISRHSCSSCHNFRGLLRNGISWWRRRRRIAIHITSIHTISSIYSTDMIRAKGIHLLWYNCWTKRKSFSTVNVVNMSCSSRRNGR